MMPLYPNSTLTNDTIITDLPRAKGVEGAKAYPTRPNTRDDIWDEDENYIYVRHTNSQGQIVSLDRYEYSPAPIPTMEELFVTKDDFNGLKGELNDVKQSIQDLISAINRNTNANTAEAEPDAKPESIGKSNGNSRTSKAKS